MRCIIKLGDWVEALINLLTLGHGQSIAEWVAKKLGYQDCGCQQRKEWLNNLVGCKNKDIKITNGKKSKVRSR